MKVLIAGGSGLIGRRLTELLPASGHQVAWLGRSRPVYVPEEVVYFHWNPEKGEISREAVEWADAVINLAGASIGENPWNEAGKKKILESRIQSVQTLTKAFAHRKPLKAFTGISGAGYYGPGNFAFHEEDSAGTDFPALVASAWEIEYQYFMKECHPEHFVILRLAVVLSKKGGALEKILQPFYFGVGALLGNGKQPFNWIHLEDAAQVIVQAMGWDGVYNASAPAKDNNAALSRKISRILKRPMIMPPVPAFVLRLFLGERSALVLQGNHSNVERLKRKGYQFRFPDLSSALRNLLEV
jgi:uncharacterized protein (TIGR01777 family)